MDFGIGIATSSDSWRLAQRAEELGFTHAWFFDTQMITADCFVAMAAAAMKTTRIRLGTGVLVPSNRIAAVTANAFATLNGLAPGRIDFGIGTGFTARRAMGLGAMKLADMEEYIRVVYGLLAGQTVETAIEGKQRKIRFLNPELDLFNTRDPIPLHISAYGPKSQALTAKLNAKWKCFIQDVDHGVTALRSMQQSWEETGRLAEDLYATAWACGCVLRPGELADSPRALAQAGPRAATLLHRAADAEQQGWANTMKIESDSIKESIAYYLDLARNFEPPDAQYLDNHRGHLVFVKPDERPFITSELIRRTSFTATEKELTERVVALRDAGWNQFVVAIPPRQERAIEDWARIKNAVG
ncbi:MAG TPA: LLM class flavin-dependent oxidoreductase [Stellaceae bacterium]|jgi:5,10-methylenetetrahydromethanopterin reductase|nr:LLM class flavin-dependent oxidoreductase [Stellaceae bacterium]